MCVTPCQDTGVRRKVKLGVAQMITPVVSIQRRIYMDIVKNRNQINIVEKLDFGRLDAELDTSILNYFVQTGSVEEIKKESIWFLAVRVQERPQYLNILKIMNTLKIMLCR